MRFNSLVHGLVIFLICFNCYFVNCWESYELDLFDLVEEVNQNFYEFMGVDQKSESNEIKKAFRRLSLLYHPDRNQEPDAEKKFRYLVAINDVLKDEVKRARYDKVLEHGLPDWKTPMYYFRRVRKLTLYELAVTLSIIITIGHYFVMWAQHFEKKLTLDDRISDVRQLIEKKRKKKKDSPELKDLDAQLQNMYDTLPAPSLKQTLPIRLCVWMYYQARESPSLIVEMIKNKKKSTETTEESDNNEQIKPVKMRQNKSSSKLHLDLNPKNIQKSDITPVVAYNLNNNNSSNKSEFKNETDDNKNKDWTDKEKSDLIKAIAKFPAGTVNRWNRISEMVGRSSKDCLEMEKSMKTNLSTSSFSNLNASVLKDSIKSVEIKENPTIASQELDAKATNEFSTNDVWSQEQQKILEKALKEISKDVLNRWDRISEMVPDKSKDDCINRYKSLCAAVKKK